jgi:hypothetical protein
MVMVLDFAIPALSSIGLFPPRLRVIQEISCRTVPRLKRPHSPSRMGGRRRRFAYIKCVYFLYSENLVRRTVGLDNLDNYIFITYFQA